MSFLLIIHACEEIYIRAVSSTTGDVGVYLVHIDTCCNYLSGDNNKFSMVMVVSGRVISTYNVTTHSQMQHRLHQRHYYVTILLM